MKNIILISLGLFMSTMISGQSVVNFSYDNSGNRVLRELVPNLINEENSARNTQVNELGVHDISVYPNPAKSELFVNLNAFTGKQGTLKIVNVYGQEVSMMKIDQITNSKFRVELSDFTNGMYHIVFNRENKEPIIKKVIISNVN